MKTEIIKSWQTVHFNALNKDGSLLATIELTINHDEKTFLICTPNQELVSLNGCMNDFEKLQAKISLLKKVEQFLKEEIEKL